MNKSAYKTFDRRFRMSLVFFPLFLIATLIVSTSSWANPGRAVYVNGQVHRIYGATPIRHVSGAPRDPASNDWVFIPSSDKHNSPWNMYYTYMNGTSLAVFDNKIFYAYTSASCTGCTPMYPYVVAFDLASNSWITNSQKKFPQVRAKAGAGAAITVFDNKLYLFTDAGTYTSGDGTNWTSYGRMFSDNLYEPLDAVTYYPPPWFDTDYPPRILIVYGYANYTDANFYSRLATANWNGQFGTSSDFPTALTQLGDDHIIYGHVSLETGTYSLFPGDSVPGSQSPAVQLFAEVDKGDGPSVIEHWGYGYGAYFGTWTESVKRFYDTDKLYDVWTYPWYTDKCDSTVTPPHPARVQSIVVNYGNKDTGVYKGFAATSDYMIPVNQGIPISSCSDWGGSSTDTLTPNTSPASDPLRKYWSLYGVILGSPPFAHNNVADYEVPNLSNVDYGEESGTQVQHTQQWENVSMFSAGLTVRAGLFHELFDVEDKADIVYRHGLEHEQKNSTALTTGFSIPLGTEGENVEDRDNLGTMGWAIFGIPKVVVQDYALYAYSYDLTAGRGVKLDQHVHVVEVNPGAVTVKPYAFELANPGGPNDDVPGLLSGIRPFPKSTDLSGWSNQAWESTEMPWDVVFGDGTYYPTIEKGKINALSFTTGASGGSSFVSETTDEETSEGETTHVEVSNETEIGVGTKLAGFKVGLKAGYDSGLKTTVTNTTSFGKEFKVRLSMKPCNEAGCVRSLTVQPYFLKATDASAPWIPSLYTNQRPWALTYQVKDHVIYEGPESGMSASPEWAEGVIVGRLEGSSTTGESGLSWYTIEGAQLGWKNSRGKLRRIPMNAIGFDPEAGITIELNGFLWSSQGADGAWNRHGNVWTFESSPLALRNKVLVRLDFGKGTWDFYISRVDFSGRFAAMMGDVRAALVVNGKYTMRTVLRNNFVTEWRWAGQPEYPGRAELTSYQGRYDSSLNQGSIALQGTLPDKIEAFGDVSFEVNGRPVNIPLLDLEDFYHALENDGMLVYEREGLRLEVDFASKTWTATIENADFERLLAPLRGYSRVRVLVGGVRWGTFDVLVDNFTSHLTLKNN